MKFLQMLDANSVYIIIGLAAFVLILLVLYIVNVVQMAQLRKRYRIFMEGNDAKNLEKTLIKRLDQVDMLLAANSANERDIKILFKKMRFAYQKSGLVKYDAFNEMGGKLSSSLALLNETNDGYMLNTVHGRDGCYIYIKEIVKGNSLIMLTEEEREALALAMGEKKQGNE